jgi:hypothetical protein
MNFLVLRRASILAFGRRHEAFDDGVMKVLLGIFEIEGKVALLSSDDMNVKCYQKRSCSGKNVV